MGISEVVSPVSRKGSSVGSVQGKPLSPGARSDPSARRDALEPTEGQEPDPAPREREAKQDQQEQGEPVPTNIHVHNVGVDPDPEAKGDSLGVMQRLANRIMGRSRHAQPYRFTNFPK
jgi:hypothetical protein